MIKLNFIFLLKKKKSKATKQEKTTYVACLLFLLDKCERGPLTGALSVHSLHNCTEVLVPEPHWPFSLALHVGQRSSVRIDGGGSSGPGSRGGLPSRSSMAPASMMSSSSSSSGASSSWGLVEAPHFRGRPFLPAAAAEGVRQASTSGSRHPAPTCAAPPSQGGRCQRTWAEVPLPHVAQERGLGAAAVLAHLALELLYDHHLHHGLQAL